MPYWNIYNDKSSLKSGCGHNQKFQNSCTDCTNDLKIKKDCIFIPNVSQEQPKVTSISKIDISIFQGAVI